MSLILGELADTMTHGGRSEEVTRLLLQYADGNRQSLNEVIPIVYEELKVIARAQLNRSSVANHVQTTALVHEAFEKLAVGVAQSFENRRHFFAIASRAMRQIVVDTYRNQNAAKRGGGLQAVELETSQLVDFENPESVLDFDAAMERLAKDSSELAQVIDLACFGGLSNDEIAELTGTTVRTVQRKLIRARAWLAQILEGEDTRES